MKTASDDWAEVNGVCLRYRCSGHGTQTLVLIHEMGGCIEGTDEVAEVLGDCFRVIQYDQRGFGLSEKTDEITIDDQVSDLAALLDHLDIREPVVLAGAALGAAIAIAFTLEHPQRVSMLVMSSPATGGMTAAARQGMEARLDAVHSGGMRGVTDAMLAHTYPAAMSCSRERFERHRRRLLTADPASFISVNGMLADLELESALPRITCPALVIGCTHDPVRSAARCAELAQLMPAGRFTTARSGHFMPIQHPEEFAALVTNFVHEQDANR
jgi:pimeloyl-ACP methyl ester carboxylesterase